MESSPIQLPHAPHRNLWIIPGNGFQRTRDAPLFGHKAECGYAAWPDHGEVTPIEREYQIRGEALGQRDDRRVDATEWQAAVRIDEFGDEGPIVRRWDSYVEVPEGGQKPSFYGNREALSDELESFS